MHFQMSTSLSDIVNEILGEQISRVYEYDVTLVNPDTEYELEMHYLNQMVISQDFAVNYMDAAWITSEVDPDDHKQILANLQGLTCTITMYPYDTINRVRLDSEEPLFFEYRAYMIHQPDLDKTTTAGVFNTMEEKPTRDTPGQQQKRIAITLNLITEDAHELRHVKINTKFNEAKLEDIIHFVSERIKCEKTVVIPPDNKEVYTNLLIPPVKDMSTLFPYLHERYGIYAKGLAYYYVDKTLYVYPKMCIKDETTPDKTILNVYNVPNTMFSGIECYHRFADETLDVVSNVSADIDTPATVSTENRGNVHMLVHADGLRDKFATIEPKGGKVMRNNEDDIASVARQNVAPDMKKEMQNIKYVGETVNPFRTTEMLASEELSRLRVAWRRATPGIIKPGINMMYHYDDREGKYQTRKGRVHRVLYTGAITDNAMEKGWMIFTAHIESVIVPDATSEEQTNSQ